MPDETPLLPSAVEHRILRLDEVEAKSGFKRAHIYNLMKAAIGCMQQQRVQLALVIVGKHDVKPVDARMRH